MLLRLAWIAKPIIAARIPDVAKILVSSNSKIFDKTSKVGVTNNITSTSNEIISGIFALELTRSCVKNSYLYAIIK